MAVDRSRYKLGRLPTARDPRTLKLSRYLRVDLPLPPPSRSWANPQGYGMLGNDTVGDCVEAAALHQVQDWSAANGGAFAPTTAQALAAYSTVAGYVPDEPLTDRGTDPLAMMKFWRAQGIAGGHRIAGFVEVDPSDATEVMHAIDIFGGLQLALDLPVSAQTQDLWDLLDNDGGAWGGHMVYLPGYEPAGPLVVTWGELQRSAPLRAGATWRFVTRYAETAFAVFSDDWLKGGAAPNKLDRDHLVADLAALSQS